MTQRVSFRARKIATGILVGIVGVVVVLSFLKVTHQTVGVPYGHRIFPEMVKPAAHVR